MNVVPRWLTRGLIGFVALAIVLVIVGLLVGSVSQRRTREATRIEAPDGIESLETVMLGGVDQTIYLRGHDQGKPVLLYLHGGRGSPENPAARRHYKNSRPFIPRIRPRGS